MGILGHRNGMDARPADSEGLEYWSCHPNSYIHANITFHHRIGEADK